VAIAAATVTCNAITGVEQITIGEGGPGAAPAEGGSSTGTAGHGAAGVGGEGAGTTTTGEGGGSTSTTTDTTSTTDTTTDTTSTTSTTTTTTTTTTTATGTCDGLPDWPDSTRLLCINYINQLRGSIGLPALSRWSSAESCTDEECCIDSHVNHSHSAFNQCGEWAQNECPGWGGPPESMITGCLDMMWAEGPGGGHYDNMTNTSYDEVVCGFYEEPDGSVWAIQNFR
jgi:hypothetical protein